jgi:pimeloyl-ACP methyl ester carboxylesterase
MGILDSLLPHFKEVVVTRGFKYHYYYSAPTPSKPTLLFIHGFPSLALDWHHQITYFEERGYGLVVPNQLGYGGSDKPPEVKDYVQSLIAKDMVDILDHEKATDVIVVGHDWYVFPPKLIFLESF